MGVLEDYLKAKKAAEALRREADRARGALDHALSLLESSCGVKTVEEGEKLLEDLDAEIRALKKELALKLAEIDREFESKYDP